MPGHEARIVRLLDEEAGVPAQDIRTQQILHGIENLRMPDHLIDPGEEHVAAMAHLALDRTTASGFIILELLAKAGHFALAERIDRKVVAALAIGLDLAFAQQFGHGFPPVFLLFVSGRGPSARSKVILQFRSVNGIRSIADIATQQRRWANSNQLARTGSVLLASPRSICCARLIAQQDRIERSAKRGAIL